MTAQAAERAVRAERLGLARDLHDVLAHELSALVVTVHAARVDPTPAALTGIAEGGERIAAALPGLLGTATGTAGSTSATPAPPSSTRRPSTGWPPASARQACP